MEREKASEVIANGKSSVLYS